MCTVIRNRGKHEEGQDVKWAEGRSDVPETALFVDAGVDSGAYWWLTDHSLVFGSPVVAASVALPWPLLQRRSRAPQRP